MGYFGSKATSGLCQPLIAMMPPHCTYIETHLGGGAIMKRKLAALRNIGIDRDARALDAFECDYPVELVHGCAHQYLAEFTFEGTELLYCDPPYLKHTRRSKRRYRFDYEESDHVELLELLAAVPCQVMVSGYACALYETRLARWRRVELQVMKKHETAVLRFAKHPDVAFTNNRAERDLRMSKVKQKVSGCFRTRKYAEAYCRISSYLQSMANQGYNPLVAIQIALAGRAVDNLPE